jgi:hypothetical protein
MNVETWFVSELQKGVRMLVWEFGAKIWRFPASGEPVNNGTTMNLREIRLL